jgi:ubiquinone/menaquinone biosynthesis C-methylase UbiE
MISMKGIRNTVAQWGVFGFELGRGIHFLAQMRALQWITRWAIPGGFPTRMRDRELEKKLLKAILELFKEDAKFFGEGRFPLAMLRPEGPLSHGLRTAEVLVDGLRLLKQKSKGRTTVFSEGALERAVEKPRYYQRNFHFQQDGYLSAKSARLYEHQVEILFTGTADAMRRLVLRPLVERWGNSGGKGIRILEIGAGTGRASRFILQSLPLAHLTVTDLSEVYLQRARDSLSEFDRVDFVRAAGEKLPFKDGEFDAVVSVFLFHELPLEVRSQVLREMVRVASPGALLAGVDSLQLHDAPDFGPLLEQFPKDFHEPFFRCYIDSPLEGLFEAAGIRHVQSSTGFVSKLVVGDAPAPP